MPFESMIIVVAIVTVFGCFAGVLAWGERQTRFIQPTPTAEKKHRAF